MAGGSDDKWQYILLEEKVRRGGSTTGGSQ